MLHKIAADITQVHLGIQASLVNWDKLDAVGKICRTMQMIQYLGQIAKIQKRIPNYNH